MDYNINQQKLIFNIVKKFCNGVENSKNIRDIVDLCDTNQECLESWKNSATKQWKYTPKQMLLKNLSSIIPLYSRKIFYNNTYEMYLFELNKQKKYYWKDNVISFEILNGKYIRLDDIEEKYKRCVNILESKQIAEKTTDKRKKECMDELSIFEKIISKYNYTELPNKLRNIKYIKDYKYQKHSKNHLYDKDEEKKIYKYNESRKNPKSKNTYVQDIQQKPEPKYDFDDLIFKEIELEDPEYILKDGSKLKYKFKYQEDYYKEKQLSTIGKEPLFTISYKRSEKACLNYRAEHFFGSDFDNRLCFLFLQEQDIEEYYVKWGGLGFIFVYIPKLQGFTDVFEDFGLGQTRRCLQVFSKYILNDLELDYYWSLDDNIPYFWKLKDEKIYNKETSINDFQIIEDKGVSIIMNEIIQYKNELPEPKLNGNDIEQSIQKAMIGCFQNRGTFNFTNKLLPNVFGVRQHHIKKFLLISSKTCYNKMVFYRGIGHFKYGILDNKLCKKPLYSHCKEQTTFSRDLCESQVSIYKLYNFIFFGYRPDTGGVSEEFIINKRMSENIYKQHDYDENGIIEDENGIIEDENGIIEDENGIIEDENGIIEDENGIIEPYPIPNLITSEIISNNHFYTKYYTMKKKHNHT